MSVLINSYIKLTPTPTSNLVLKYVTLIHVHIPTLFDKIRNKNLITTIR
jgi:cytochrome c oxidase assembly factor CtaG